MTVDDGGLGFAFVQEFKLYLWSRDSSLNRWAQRRVMDLGSLLPISALSTSPKVIAYVDGADVIFINAYDAGIFAIHLKLGKVTKVGMTGNFDGIVPYMNFYTPGINLSVFQRPAYLYSFNNPVKR